MSATFFIIPTYNEAANLPLLVDAIEREFQGLSFNIIIIDDNSPDGTADIGEKLNKKYKNIIVKRRKNKLGIGSAIRYGFHTALFFPSCKYIVTMDADLSHNPKDMLQVIKNDKEVGIVQGSRYVNGGNIIGWDVSRKIISFLANQICKIMFRVGINDYTGNYRVYSRDCALSVLLNSHAQRYGWPIESIVIASRYGYNIEEIPITFVNRVHGTSKLSVRDMLRWISSVSIAFLKNKPV